MSGTPDEVQSRDASVTIDEWWTTRAGDENTQPDHSAGTISARYRAAQPQRASTFFHDGARC
jgi:hypothetical protein